MKKRLLLWILAGLMCLGFVSCGEKSANTPIPPPPEDSTETEKPNYDLGDFENENDEDWWNKPDAPDEPSEPNEPNEPSEPEVKPPKDSEITGETIPY